MLQVEALDPQTWSHHHDRALHVPSVAAFTNPNSEQQSEQLNDSRNPSQHSSRVGLPPIQGHSQHGQGQGGKGAGVAEGGVEMAHMKGANQV